MMRNVTTMAVVTLATVAVSAQEPTFDRQLAERRVFETKVQNMRVSVESRVTRNAPYSAEAVTESVQQLADGNRIVTRNATRIYRDGEGRTRREQLNPPGTDVVNINISDPATGNTFVLDPATHMAYRNGFVFTAVTDRGMGAAQGGGRGVFVATRPPGVVTITGQAIDAKGGAEVMEHREATTIVDVKERVAAVGGGNAAFSIGGLQAMVPDAVGKTTKEDLGQQTIEGVIANGTRTTTEIPAGAIGNDQPIKVVSEQWFSPELQVLVLTKHTDPRVGETVYRLTGVVRAEPARALFELPADYTLKESAIRRQEP